VPPLPVRPVSTNTWFLTAIFQILAASPLGELEETTGTSPYYVDEDYPAGPGITEPLPERSN